jgi:hypothetical protein
VTRGAAGPQERFDELVDEFAGRPGVTLPGQDGGPSRFGSSALKVHGRIFAMLVRDELVVKLPKARVDQMVEAGEGVRFDANKGTPMKEWLVLAGSSKASWSALAGEALAFVRGARAGARPGQAGRC